MSDQQPPTARPIFAKNAKNDLQPPAADKPAPVPEVAKWPCTSRMEYDQ